MKILLTFLLVALLIIAGCSKDSGSIPTDPDTPTEPTFISKSIGDTADVTTMSTAGACLMGGSTDVDAAFKWMIAKSGGGDFVIIRFDEGYGYNSYIYRMRGINSVETIIISSDADANNPKIATKIRNAEALFIAGGDQAKYVKYWKNTPVEDAINYLINTKHAPVGGTSAGCAILGSSYFAALKGSVTSVEAMRNPYSSLVSLGHHDFIDIPYLRNTITDQHYSQREREGRLVTFMARMDTDLNKNPRGIAVDEETAVCIDENGIAIVFGSNSAFFLQRNSLGPEACLTGTPLTWNRDMQAIQVYRIAGSPSGNGSFDLKDFSTTSGGTWLYYYVNNAIFYTN